MEEHTQRAAEAVADQKALDAAKAEYQALRVTDGELRDRLASLRGQFKRSLNSSVEILHRTVK